MLSSLVPIASELERRVVGNFSNSSQLARLESKGGRSGAVLAELLRATIDRRTTPIEAQYVRSIEELRGSLEQRTEVLEIQDFGAADGQADGQGSQQGRVVHLELGKFCRRTSRRPATGLLLMKLLEAFRPETVLEFGTSVGISAAYQTAALQINGRGKLYTLEGAQAVATVAAANLRTLGLLERAEIVVGRFVDTLPGVLQRIGSIDFAFIDGHHDYTATLELFKQIKPQLSQEAVVVFDDVSWSPGMAAAWKKVQADPEVGTVVDLFSMGLCIMHEPKQLFRIALPKS